MKKKLLATAIAGAMVVPSAFAAQDNVGMHFTSASEGFYASIRAEYHTGENEDSGTEIRNSWGPSRFGIRGTNDLGGGLEGFYHYEAGVSIDNGGDLNTRFGHVGLRGAFGQVRAGSFWAQNYNWLTGSTDVANTGSGNLYSSANGGIQVLGGRVNRTIEYTTPDLNGFQAAAHVIMSGAAEQGGEEVVGSDDNDIDAYVLTGRYGVAGFDVAASYSVLPDGLENDRAGNFTFDDQGNPTPLFDADGNAVGTDSNSRDDHTGYAVKVGYSQDNWYVNAWYSEDNSGDQTVGTDVDNDNDADADGAGPDGIFQAVELVRSEDIERFAIAGGVEVGKVNVYAIHENQEQGAVEDAWTIFGVQYNLGSRSRVWIDYVNQDLDGSETEDDYVAIGMRHDF